MKRALVIHPLLFAIFPALFLYSRNIDSFRVGTILGPIAATACLTLVSWLVLSLVLGDMRKAGLIVSLFFLLFFSYDSFLEGIEDFMRGLGASRAWTRRYLWRYLLLTWAILFGLGTHFFVKTRRSLHNLTNIANVVACVLVVISLVNIGAYEVKTMSAWQAGGGTESVETNPTYLEEPDMLPDIYYIILDGYGRADVLKDIYEYDNSEFLDYLTGKGFFVANRSRSNYSQTAFSLASSLNLNYLDGLVRRVGAEYPSLMPAYSMTRDNRVFRFLEYYGYVIVAFSTGWVGTELRNADIYLAPRGYPDEFQSQLMNMTPIEIVARELQVCDKYGLHRERILYTLDQLEGMAELEGPVFVFAHIIAPHPPFVFGRHGEEIDPEYPFTLRDGSRVITRRKLTRDEYVHGYREQLIFINSRIQAAVDGILSRSARPTIIVLQADHGPGSMLDREDPDNTDFKERLSILNAYYLPNGGDIQLYDGITPVNTFRLLLNHYFGTNHQLLDDESYFSTRSRPYAFINVTGEMSADIGTQHWEW
jgi:hypothetical protein